MAGDTTSPLLQLLLMGTGNDNNSWGDNANNSVFIPLENAIAGVTSISSTGGTVTLSAAQSRSAIIEITGALVSDLTIIVPSTSKRWAFVNLTTGAQVAQVKISGGVARQLPQNRWVDIASDGISTTLLRSDGHSVGEIFFTGATSVPGGALECTGAAISRTQYVDLFAKIGTTFGAGDGFTTFNLPPGYDTGRFLRSRTASVALGTSQSNQNKTHTHTGSGTTSGTSNDHTHTGSGTTSTESASHTHTGSGTTTTESVTHTHSGTTGNPSVSLIHTHTFSGTTGTMSANASHTHTINYTGASTLMTNTGGSAMAGGGFGSVTTISIASTNTDHTHTFSGTTDSTDLTHTHTITTGTESATHTHTYSFTTSTPSVTHTHTFSFTSSGQSADHTHTYSFTTSTGSADGTEARPEALVAIMCIRY